MRCVLIFIIGVFFNIICYNAHISINNINEDLNTLVNHIRVFAETIFNKDEMTTIDQCLVALSDKKTFNHILGGSGKGLSDPGSEKYCIDDKDFNYYLMIYTISKKLFELDEEWEIIEFLQRKSNFLTGLCVHTSCNSTITLMQNNQGFKEFLESQGITHLTFNNIGYDALPPKTNSNYLPYKIMIYILSGVVCFMIFSFFFNYLLTVDAESMNQPNSISASDNDYSYNKDCMNETDFIIQQRELQLKASQISIANTTTYIKADEEEKKSIILSILNFFSLGQNFSNIFDSINTSLYDESSLEFISVLRFIFLCFITFNHTYYAFMKMQEEDYFNIEFYTSPFFALLKATLFGIDFSIILDAFIMSYKLMWYLKKNCYSKYKIVTLKIIGTFCLLTIPKMIVFIVEYYLVFLYSPNIACDLNTTPYRLFYHASKTVGVKDCEKNHLLVFIPFYLQYKDYFSDTHDTGYQTCFRYVLVYLNEFICFYIVMILIYLMHKIRSKIFDNFIGIVILIGISFTFLDFIFMTDANGKFNLSFYLGQTLTLKYPHLFFPIYMLGVFAGIIYFYHNDAITSAPIRNDDEDNYIPFEFCITIMKLIDYLGNVYNFIISLLCIIIFALLCLTYYFFRLWMTSDTVGFYTLLNFPLNSFINLLYYYDRAIILSCFVIFLLIQFIETKHTFITNWGSFRMMKVITRVSFSALFCADTIVYITLIVFDFDSVMNYSDCFILTIGVFCINIVLSSIATVIIEVPIRVLIKMVMKKIANSDNIDGKSKKSLFLINKK